MERIKSRLNVYGCYNIKDYAMNLEDEDKEHWIIGQAYKYLIDRYDDIEFKNLRVFDIHTLHTRSREYLDFLKSVEHPIIMQNVDVNFKNTIKYPLQEIISKYKSDYFLCSFSYMFALAMYLGYEEIGLYGINMSFSDDYIQKYNCEYWLGRCEQSGIELINNSDLLKCGSLYGFEVDNTLAVYQQKYINELDKEIKFKLDEASQKIKIAKDLYDLKNNRNKEFCKEILDRHKLNGSSVTVDYDKWLAIDT
jgi:hypothetical protein